MTQLDFPDDENGNVLRQLAAQGIDLTVERDVEFLHAAPDERRAVSFAAAVRARGGEAEVFDPDEESLAEGHTDWDVCCVRRMVPTHASITGAEVELGELARVHGCRPDGWGFME